MLSKTPKIFREADDDVEKRTELFTFVMKLELGNHDWMYLFHAIIQAIKDKKRLILFNFISSIVAVTRDKSTSEFFSSPENRTSRIYDS